MTRERLPNRRRSLVLDLDHQGARYSLGVGFFEGSKPGEIFLSGAKPAATLTAYSPISGWC